jgi:cell division protein FtsZ
VEEANVIFGIVFDEKMEDRVRITVVATGFASDPMEEANRAFNSSMPAAPTVASSDSDMEIPTFLRRR